MKGNQSSLARATEGKSGWGITGGEITITQFGNDV
jgi:hypothetical protein